jgi:hypothetical protein
MTQALYAQMNNKIKKKNSTIETCTNASEVQNSSSLPLENSYFSKK